MVTTHIKVPRGRKVFMSIFASSKKAKEMKLAGISPTSPLITKIVYGKQSSLMIGTRPGGYHSNPHVHACEQLNYQLEGEMFVYVEKKAYRMRKGDFLRIPADKLHWAWNKSKKRSVQIEVHTPSLHPDFEKVAVPLFDPDEKVETTSARNIMKTVPESYIKEAEASKPES
jgi:quercetin dioxygenase-like cupin family protein